MRARGTKVPEQVGVGAAHLFEGICENGEPGRV
jgi:hypothetical protein